MVKFEDFSSKSQREQKKMLNDLHTISKETFQCYKNKPFYTTHKKLNPKHNLGLCSVPKYFI